MRVSKALALYIFHKTGGKLTAAALLACAVLSPSGVLAQGADSVTFHKDIEPILQRSCQTCHRVGGVAPMSLVTYDETAPFAGLIEYKTGLRDRAGAMPPYYLEKDIGIQEYKDDPSLTDEEVAAISAWARSGAPKGDSADAPAPRQFSESGVWTAGTPDLIIRTEDVTVLGTAPDWWGDIPRVPTGLTEDRYVASVEIRAVGGRNIFHHMIWSTQILDENLVAVEGEEAVGWPVHEIARNPDIFDPEGGRLLKAGSYVVSDSVHLHSTGVDTTGHLLIGFRFHPVGYEPKYQRASLSLGNGVDISITGNEDGQELHAYAVLEQPTKIVTFEPHLHAPGERMCLEAIWGYTVETLTCVGYDHNWVRGYTYEDHTAPLLPKGAVLHIVGYMNNTRTNPNVPDSRNWQGSGNRSVTNMFIDLGMRVAMTEEQFLDEMAKRREVLNLGPNDHQIGCPLCLAPLVAPLEPEPQNNNEVASATQGVN